ncbi:MAG TPA: hypothetical protein VMP67_09275 [Candidatus Limnocylindria bacterium]|nr:hypothetical protein [Candidatus Limnocylindria bacterium]
MEISEQTRWLAGILLLAVVTIELGGLYMLALVRGRAPATPCQLNFAGATPMPASSTVAVRYVALANCPEPGLHASLLSLPTDQPGARPFEQILAEAFPALPVAG